MLQKHDAKFANHGISLAHSKPGMRISILIPALILGLSACQPVPSSSAGAITSPAPANKSAAFNSVDITGINYARSLSLPDTSNRLRKLTDFKGKVTFVFFGFTQCPDVCPTTMSDLAEVKKLLGKDGEKLQGIFVSVDPERDTPEILKEYLANFDPSFIALRGNAEQTKTAAQEFKIFYAKVPGKTENSYTVDHSTGSYVFDTQGHPRLFVRRDVGVRALAADLKALIRG
jgi:protein SCO1